MKSSPPSPCASSSRRCVRRRRGAAFTLVEILVAASVLALISAMLLQMTSSVGKAFHISQQRVNNFTKARSMLDLLAQDLEQGLYRDDLSFFPAAGNNSLLFYTQRPGVPATGAASSSRNLSLVQYLVAPDSSDAELQRGDFAISWTSAASDVSFSNPAQLLSGNRVTLRETAAGIVGFQVRFLYADGTMRTTYANGDANPLRAISVTLAVVDDQTLKQMPPGRKAALQAGLITAAPADSDVKAAWDAYLDRGVDWNAYSQSFRTGFQVFERYVHISPTF